MTRYGFRDGKAGVLRKVRHGVCAGNLSQILDPPHLPLLHMDSAAGVRMCWSL